MFFILSKTLFYLVMPLIWITTVLIYAFICKNANKRKKAVGIALILVFIFSNQFIINEILMCWEKRTIPIFKIGNYDYAIVLTGVTNSEYSYDTTKVFFNKGADRLLHTVQLYKLGKIKKIIISGGAGNLTGKQIKEAPLLKRTFIDCGVPPEDIYVEDNSRNTRENALFTKAIVDSLHLQGKFLLITSAFHMRRSEGCFHRVGMNFDIYPVDPYTVARKYTPSTMLIPTEFALSKWAILIHEVTGFVVYKMMGYC